VNRTQRQPCGCVSIFDRRGNVSAPVALMCPDHKAEYETRHAAAIESCSHALRNASDARILDTVDLSSTEIRQ
jgi:hypothetical protein